MAHTVNSSAARRPLSLFSFFPARRIFADTSRDGYPDRLELTIEVDPRLDDACIWAQVLNLTARLAFEVTALDLPVVKPLRQKPGNRPALVILRPDPSVPAAAEIKHLKPGRLAIGGSCGESIARVLAGLAVEPTSGGLLPENWRTIRMAAPDARFMAVLGSRQNRMGEIGLRPLAATPKPGRGFSTLKIPDLLDPLGGAYEVPPDEPRGRHLNMKLAIDALRLAPRLAMALADLVALAALEATDVNLPLVFAGSAPPNGLVLQVCEQTPNRAGVTHQIRLVPRRWRGSQLILAEGQTVPLTKALREWTQLSFLRHGPGCEPFDRFRAEVETVQDLIAGRGHWGRWLQHLLCAADGKTVPPPVKGSEHTRVLRACRALSLTPPAKAPSSVIKRSSSWRSETQEISDLTGRIRPGSGRLEGLVFVSKPIKTRLELKKQLTSILMEKGYRVDLEVLNAYKPGLSWLLEVVVKSLQRIEQPADIELAYRPFTVHGGSLEMRSRWLQEIFPGPDLLAGSLGWDPARIRLIRRRSLPDAYRLRAWNTKGHLVFDRGFTPRINRLPYFACWPQAGTIYPTSGGILLRQGQRVILDRGVFTDRERFWRIFQTRWLPTLEARMRTHLETLNGEGPPALWEEVRLEVALEETDVRLDLGAERICPMEALHEDLYFGLLNFFKRFRRAHRLAPAVQFGRILPMVSSRLKGNRPSARMIARPLQWCPLKGADRRSPRPKVTALSFERHKWHLTISGGIRQLTPLNVRRLCAVTQAWGFSIKPSQAEGRLRVTIKAPRPVRSAAARSGCKSPPPENRLLSAQEVSDWIQHLGRMPHLQIWLAGHTWQGRPVWAIEASLQGGGKLGSVTKARLLKPTLLINARHHANEISSTNAVLHLAWQLSATKQGQQTLKHTNIVIIPLENADGVATLEALLPGAADHKLHAARYNALGVEWYAEYFADPPRFDEARVKPRLWYRWLPKIVLDAHGVPSHEWDQPFSGYVPPKPFQEFWLPKTFVYAIVPFINRPDHPGHATAGRLVRLMQQAFIEDREVLELNRQLNDRYQRYAHSAEPRTFPACTEETLVVLPPQKRIARTNFAERHWPLTRSEIITEVTDEVASGSLLALCARAHRRVAGALIEFMRSKKQATVTRTGLPHGGAALKWRR